MNDVIEKILSGETIKPALAVKTLNAVLDQIQVEKENLSGFSKKTSAFQQSKGEKSAYVLGLEKDVEDTGERISRLETVIAKLKAMLPADTVDKVQDIRTREKDLATRKEKEELRILKEAGRIAGELSLFSNNENFEIGRNKLPWAMPGEKAKIFHAAREKAKASGFSFVEAERQILKDRQTAFNS
jgi:hypothetical protein